MDTLKGPSDRKSIQQSHEGRTNEPSSVCNSYFDGDARRELESQRHLQEPHVVELPPNDSEDMDSHNRVPSLSIQHSASNPLVDVLPQTATDALDEATNRRHAHVDRAHKGSSIQK